MNLTTPTPEITAIPAIRRKAWRTGKVGQSWPSQTLLTRQYAPKYADSPVTIEVSATPKTAVKYASFWVEVVADDKYEAATICAPFFDALKVIAERQGWELVEGENLLDAESEIPLAIAQGFKLALIYPNASGLSAKHYKRIGTGIQLALDSSTL